MQDTAVVDFVPATVVVDPNLSSAMSWEKAEELSCSSFEFHSNQGPPSAECFAL